MLYSLLSTKDPAKKGCPVYDTKLHLMGRKDYRNMAARWFLASWRHNFMIWSSSKKMKQITACPVDWSCRIHQLHLCKGVRPSNECPGYDTKQSDGEIPAMLELCRMWSTPLLPSLPGPIWLGVVAPDKGPIYGLNRTKRWLAFTIFIHLNCVFMLNWIV